MAPGPLPDKWYSRDFPVLIEIVRRVDIGEHARFEVLRDALGFTNEETAAAFRSLDRRHLIDGSRSEECGILEITDVSAEAYFLTGLHPDGEDALSSLVETLRQAAEHVDDPDERTRLRRAADSMLGISSNVAAGVLTTWISGQIPT